MTHSRRKDAMNLAQRTAGVLLPLALILTGCAATTNAGTDHTGHDMSNTADAVAANAADIMFASMMIPHHEQAVEMSDMILAKPDVDERIVALAEQISAAQGPEIEQMNSWLSDWGADPAEGMSGMHHGDGMMSDDDMAALDAASATDAARLFLEQMIVHHEGAVAMAETEVEDGQNPDAVALARAIIDSQSAEIEAMTALLEEF